MKIAPTDLPYQHQLLILIKQVLIFAVELPLISVFSFFTPNKAIRFKDFADF